MPEIYTIGHYENYMRAINEHAKEGLPITKLSGGYAFRTVKDALRRISEHKMNGQWAVWAMNADWTTDTTPAESGWWHLLNKDADITRFVTL